MKEEKGDRMPSLIKCVGASDREHTVVETASQDDCCRLAAGAGLAPAADDVGRAG